MADGANVESVKNLIEERLPEELHIVGTERKTIQEEILRSDKFNEHLISLSNKVRAVKEVAKTSENPSIQFQLQLWKSLPEYYGDFRNDFEYPDEQLRPIFNYYVSIITLAEKLDVLDQKNAKKGIQIGIL